jgi:hypothetical protein
MLRRPHYKIPSTDPTAAAPIKFHQSSHDLQSMASNLGRLGVRGGNGQPGQYGQPGEPGQPGGRRHGGSSGRGGNATDIISDRGRNGGDADSDASRGENGGKGGDAR